MKRKEPQRVATAALSTQYAPSDLGGKGAKYRMADISVIASKAVVGAIPDIGTAR